MAKRRIKVTVKNKDKGWNAVQREIAESGRQHVTVGIHGAENSRGDDIGNVQLMAIHEFGSTINNIPERSVIRHTIDKNLRTYRKLMRSLGEKIYTKHVSMTQALNLLGLKVASDMRQTIQQTPGSWRALEPATIAARQHGGTKPLLDTADLQRSIKHKVLG